MSEEELLKLIERMERRIKRAYRNFVRRSRASVGQRATERALRDGTIPQLTEIVRNEVDRFANEVSQLPIAVAGTLATSTGTTFDVTDPQVAARLLQARQRIVSSLARDVVQQMTLGVQLGPQVTIRSRALALRESIGLNEQQLRATANFERLLREGNTDALSRKLRDRRFDGTILGAIRRDEPLTEDQINRMVSRYRERQINYRAGVIAQVESLRQVGEGDEAFWGQKVSDGTFDANQIFRRWVTQRDERVRGSHAALHGTVQPLGTDFISGDGNTLRFPGDPRAPASETVNCRCMLATRVRGQAKKMAA